MHCCEEMQTDPNQMIENHTHCPMMWDGWTCWKSTESGKFAYQKCPDMAYQTFKDPPLKCYYNDAEQFCSKPAFDNKTAKWNLKTNYLDCTVPAADQYLKVTHLRIATHSVSFVILSIAIGLFAVFRQYRLMRVEIHLNFFAALLLDCIFNLLCEAIIREKHYSDSSTSLGKLVQIIKFP